MRNIFAYDFQTQSTSVYCFSRARKLTVFGGAETANSARAKFILPELNKLLTEVKSGSLDVLLVSCGMILVPVLVKRLGKFCVIFVTVVNFDIPLQLILQIRKGLI